MNKIFKKGIDKIPFLCYNNIRKRGNNNENNDFRSFKKS